MNVLDLFSGIGGFSLGLERAGCTTVAFCELDPFCRRVLAKHWPHVPIHHDIRELEGGQYKGTVDLVCGGFPCQAHSTAARGRNNAPCLWGEFARIVGEVAPAYVMVENVAGAPWGDVVGDLQSLGYGGQLVDFALPARMHVRRRLYALAYANGQGEPWSALHEEVARLSEDAGPVGGAVAGSVGVDDGVPRRMDRLRALGNAVVPQIPEIIGRAILEADATP